MTNPLHFVCLMGIPASGKTTFVESGQFEDYTIVSADYIRRVEYAQKGDVASDRAFEAFCQRGYESLLKGENVVSDGPNPTPARRAMLGLVELAENINKVPIYRELVVFRIPTQMCMDRNAARGEDKVDDELMTRHYVWFEKGLTEVGTEGWDTVSFIYDKPQT